MKLRTRRERRYVVYFKRAVVGAFVLIFIASVVGVAIVTVIH